MFVKHHKRDIIDVWCISRAKQIMICSSLVYQGQANHDMLQLAFAMIGMSKMTIKQALAVVVMKH